MTALKVSQDSKDMQVSLPFRADDGRRCFTLGLAPSSVLCQDGKESSLPCTSLILGMGAWASEAAEWFPDSTLPRRTVSNRYTSVIWDDVEVGKDATMVFTMGEDHTEIYPRSNECYANGCPTDPPLPDNPMEIEPPQDEIDRVKVQPLKGDARGPSLMKYAQAWYPHSFKTLQAESIAAVPRLKDATIIRSTACFLAGSEDHRPVVGRIPKTENASWPGVYSWSLLLYY